MQNLRVAAASVNQVPMDWRGNLRRLVEVVERARDAGVEVLCLPELAVSGYGCEDMYFSVGVQQASLQVVDELATHCDEMIVAVGTPLFYESSLYNAAAMIVNGQIEGLVCKQFMASDGIHYEPRWFRQWPAGVVGQTERHHRMLPVGDVLFDCGGIRIGFEICRDAWVAQRPGARLARRGADLLLNPSASHFAFGKQATRERFVLEGSRAFCTTFLYCNLLGNESGRSIYDGGALIATDGKIVARNRLFSYAESEIAIADVDVDSSRRARAQSFDATVKVKAGGEGLQYVYYDWERRQSDAPLSDVSAPEPWERSDAHKCEEFSRVVPLALFDYLRKSRAQGFVVSLSGGADSSAVAVLVSLMVRRALSELGPADFCERLRHVSGLAAIVEAAESKGKDLASAMTRRLLTCVYQATRHSSQTTRQAAEKVAEAIGAEYIAWDVDAISTDYVDVVSKAAGQPITWDDNDLALQNIQARTRGPSIWLLANIRGALLLATSNRSEAAVGYATMDGDTCGGLSPIAGIDKAFLREWLRWMEATGPCDMGPIPELSVVNAQAPTAELRPASAGQTDEGDLMPYEVLDAIERAAIRDKRLPADVLAVMEKQFPDVEQKQLGEWVVRFFELWCRNQWKRERYAPSFHVDDESLDPKAWCRFPILNSGFEQELEALKTSLGL